MVDNIYEKLSQERKEAQERGEYPDWFTTGGYQMFKESYEYKATGYKEQIQRVASTLSKYTVPFVPESHPLFNAIVNNYGHNWKDCFFNIMWNNQFAPSTPVLANTGTDRGCSVSCSGQVVGDSIKDFYEARKTAALLGKEGFGTSAYLGDIRPRGSPISKGGKAEGTTPVKKGLQQDARDVSQAGVRRGAVACYLPIDHPDFDEWCDDLLKNPQGQNIGWVITKDVITKWVAGDQELHRRRAKALRTKVVTGKGYWWKVDHVNEQQPQCYKDHGLTNKASNLC